MPKEPEIVETVDSEDDTVSIAGTETTDTTLVDRNDNELRDQLDSLKKELDETKKKCDRLEREKGNILLRRLTAIDTPSAKSNEVRHKTATKNQHKTEEMIAGVETPTAM